MSSTIDRPQVLVPDGPALSARGGLRKLLVASGIGASLFYVAANVFGALRWSTYSSVDQTISELFAVDAPSRPTFLAFSVPYGLLSLAFGCGVVMSAGHNRSLRLAGWLLVAVGVVNQLGPFLPMHARRVIAAGGATFSDTMHVALVVVLMALLLPAMAFSAFAFGRAFRIYSAITILGVIVFGAMTSLNVSAMEANEPTPWMGVYERVNVGAYLLWMSVLALTILHREPSVQVGIGTNSSTSV